MEKEYLIFPDVKMQIRASSAEEARQMFLQMSEEWFDGFPEDEVHLDAYVVEKKQTVRIKT
jgi:hypothetical protein